MPGAAEFNQLASNLLLPELVRQLKEGPSLWPNVKRLFVLIIAKKNKPVSTWYLVLQRKNTMPLITDDEEKAETEAKVKLRTVRIQVEDCNMVNFITGEMTGLKAYMTGKIKVRGNLMLAQRVEKVFAKVGSRKRAIHFISQNNQLRALTDTKANL